MAYNPQNANGQATMANSAPVVIASNQTAVPVSGTFYQATQPVSIASSVAVTGTFYQATQPVSIASSVAVTGPLTDTQLRATAVPVSLASLPSLAAGSNAIGSITNTSFASTQSGTWNITNISGTVSLPTGAATSAKQPALGTAGSASTDVLTVQGIASMTALKVDGSAVTQPVSGTVTANAGTGTMNVTVVSSASGGDSTFHLVSAATTNATNIKASAGKVTGWYIYNSNASARKVAFHNTAGTPTAGASIHSAIIIPGLAAANVSFPDGIDFGTGIAITTVTDLTDAGNTAVALNDLIINIYYK